MVISYLLSKLLELRSIPVQMLAFTALIYPLSLLQVDQLTYITHVLTVLSLRINPCNGILMDFPINF